MARYRAYAYILVISLLSVADSKLKFESEGPCDVDRLLQGLKDFTGQHVDDYKAEVKDWVRGYSTRKLVNSVFQSCVRLVKLKLNVSFETVEMCLYDEISFERIERQEVQLIIGRLLKGAQPYLDNMTSLAQALQDGVTLLEPEVDVFNTETLVETRVETFKAAILDNIDRIGLEFLSILAA
ncbi:hypothetical protein HDE_01452 [Halotydeus destructor]|nr:hypothetical protein HDE_01452 [Halotydeus destructor]